MRFSGTLLAAILAGFAAKAQASWWRSAPQLDPSQAAEAAYKKGLYPRVIELLSSESLPQVPPRHQERAYEELAESCVRMGRLSQALGTYQLAVKLFPRDVRLLADFGDLLHQEGLDEQAKPFFDAALKIKPNDAKANIGMAQISAALGFLRRSRIYYAKAIKTKRDDPDLWAQDGEILWRLKNYPEAERAVRRSLALSSSTQTEILLAFIERSQGRLTQALDDLERAQGRHPERQDIALARALWMTEAGQWEKALRLDGAILSKSPDNPLALWIKASILLHAGKRPAAKAALKTAAKAQEQTPFVAAVAAKMLQSLPQDAQRP